MSTTNWTEGARQCADEAWAMSDQSAGTMPRVRRAGFDAGFRAGYELALGDFRDIESGELDEPLGFPLAEGGEA